MNVRVGSKNTDLALIMRSTRQNITIMPVFCCLLFVAQTDEIKFYDLKTGD